MLSFIAQYDKHHGPDGAHQYKLILDIDESHKAGLKSIMDCSKGDTFMILMLPVDEEFGNMSEATTESEDMTINRLRKQMHALIREVSAKNGLTTDETRLNLKELLKKKKCIKESTSELDVKGFATAIYILQNEF